MSVRFSLLNFVRIRGTLYYTIVPSYKSTVRSHINSHIIKELAAKTWAQFKIDFSTAHREFRLTNQTAQQYGFHSANMMIEQSRDGSMQETAEAIAQLATATASDRGTAATLTTTNEKLATQLEAAHALITQLKSEIATLMIKIKPVWQGQRPARTTNNDSHCWSHGFQILSHTPVLHAMLEKLGIKRMRQESTPWVEYNGAKNDTEGQLRT
jgi:hypothetical protein